jgi:putative hemolysin
MVMLLAGRLPSTGDRCEWSGWTFEVVDMDGKRIDKVLARQASGAGERGDVRQPESFQGLAEGGSKAKKD